MNIYKGLKKIVIWFGVKLNFGSLFSRSSRNPSVTFSEYASQMVEASYLSAGEVLKELDSSFLGLSEEKILEKTKADEPQFEQNLRHKDISLFRTFVRCLLSPFSVILLVIFFYNIFLFTFSSNSAGGQRNFDLISILIIGIMLIFSVIINYLQEIETHRVLTKITKKIETEVDALRLSRIERNRIFKRLSKTTDQKLDLGEYSKRVSPLPSYKLLAGDVVYLSAGDFFSTDLLILDSRDLFVNQASITGESVPVEKFPELTKKRKKFLTTLFSDRNKLPFLDNICLSGTHVASGIGIGLVLNNEENSYSKKTASFLESPRELSRFDSEIKKLSFFLLVLTIVVIFSVILFRSFFFGFKDLGNFSNLISLLLFISAVAVGLIPEMLPVVMNLILFLSIRRSEKENVIFKNLRSVYNLGSIKTLCIDKTGTLTENTVTILKYLGTDGRINRDVLAFGYLSSLHQTGFRNIIDQSIISYTKDIFSKKELSDLAQWEKIDEIPFNFVKRRMAIILRSKKQRKVMVASKGAVEDVIQACNYYRSGDGKILPIIEENRIKSRNLCDKFARNGFRTVGIASFSDSSEKNKKSGEQNFVSFEKQLCFEGYIVFFDPPKESARGALAFLKKHNIEVKILTGDNDKIALWVCKKLDLEVTGLIRGTDLNKIVEESDLKEVVKKANLFTDMNPAQKSRIVSAIKSSSGMTGFLGDGINDAEAMYFSDVGISVANATDVSRESSDVILKNKDLRIIDHAVVNSRSSVINIIKYVKITLSSNFGNVLSLVTASIWFSFLPMLPIQVLIQNLLYDLNQLGIVDDSIEESLLRFPKIPTVSSILAFLLIFGPLSSLFDCLFFIFFPITTLSDPQVIFSFQRGWFFFSFFSQILGFFILRSPKTVFSAIRPSSRMLISLLSSFFVVFFCGTVLLFFPSTFFFLSFSLFFSSSQWLVIIFLTFAYLLTINSAKYFYQWFIDKKYF